MHTQCQYGVAYNPFLKVKGKNIPQACFLAVLVSQNFFDCNSSSMGQWGTGALQLVSVLTTVVHTLCPGKKLRCDEMTNK